MKPVNFIIISIGSESRVKGDWNVKKQISVLDSFLGSQIIGVELISNSKVGMNSR